MKRYLIGFFLVFIFLLAGCVKTNECTAHIDENGDYRCDQCQQSVLIRVDFYTINDLHGKLADGEGHIGVDELTTYLRTMQAKDDYAYFLSAGDMWQGSAESNLTYGRIITDWMNELNFTAMTLGNHEFDWGEAEIQRNADLAEFPLLSINIYDRDTDRLVEYCQPSVVVDCGAIQIGIIGAIGDCYSSIAPEKVQDVYFKTGNELTNLVKAESDRLRSEEGVELVIYILHDGNGRSGGSTVTDNNMASYYDISLSDGYVDMVFEGHTHQKYLLRDSKGVYHAQCGGDNKGISHVEIAYNTLTGECIVTESDLLTSDIYERMADDPVVNKLLERYADEISKANVVLGNNAAYRNSNWLRQVVADLYFQAGQEKWGDEYDIVLAGGYLNVRSPYHLEKGQVTYGILQTLFPFDNELVLCSISGRDLLDRFINSNNDSYYICRGDNRKIDPNATYYIVVDSYTSSYAPNRLTEVARYGAAVYARDLLADFIADGGME